MSLINFLKTCFNLSSKPRSEKLQNIYNKIDKIEKHDDGFMIINSSEGFTEDEYLQIIQNEFFNE